MIFRPFTWFQCRTNKISILLRFQLLYSTARSQTWRTSCSEPPPNNAAPRPRDTASPGRCRAADENERQARSRWEGNHGNGLTTRVGRHLPASHVFRRVGRPVVHVEERAAARRAQEHKRASKDESYAELRDIPGRLSPMNQCCTPRTQPLELGRATRQTFVTFSRNLERSDHEYDATRLLTVRMGILSLFDFQGVSSYRSEYIVNFGQLSLKKCLRNDEKPSAGQSSFGSRVPFKG